MQPSANTERPWAAWHGWERHQLDRFGRRRVRLSLQDLADLRDLRSLKIDWRLSRPEITVYTPNQIRHLIRLDNSLSARPAPAPAKGAPYPTIPASWIRGLPRDLQENGGPWRLPDLRALHVAAPRPSPAPAGAGAAWWEAAARTLPVGAVLLALLVLLARGAEKCLEKRFFKLSRRRSEEWPTPNVLATNLRHRRDLELPAPADAFPPDVARPPAPDADPPPPYSECARARAAEEPPPPYSACYVTYSNPKDGVPSVHFFNGRRQRLFGPASAAGRSSAAGAAARPGPGVPGVPGDPPGCEENEADARDRRFVFENGRIVETDPENDAAQIPVDRSSGNEVVALGDAVAGSDRAVAVNAMGNAPQRSALVA